MGTITKALEILNHFSRSRAHIGLGEFVKLTGRDKATVHRHLVELEANGFLEQHAETRAYRLGPAILRLNAVREAGIPFRAVVRPIVTALSNELGELSHASLLQGDMLSPVFHHDPGAHGTQVHFDEAEMLPLHATSSGLAVLAHVRPEMVERLLSRDLARYTSNTPTDPEFVRSALAAVRREGVSRLDRAFDEEVSSQGAPIFGSDNRVIGALSVAIPAVRATPDKLDTIERHLRAAAEKITLSLGGTAGRSIPDMTPSKLTAAGQNRPGNTL
ncbi:MAG: IclR family transcriptional regulator [Sulfitobacter sp.]|nr:IclR family transcriptional regulator [Sulfitobacter sp.]